jgi:hypothetical protein
VISEGDARRVTFDLLADAFVWIRAVSINPDQPEEIPTAQELANLFHNVPRQLWALDHPVEATPPMPSTATDVLQRIKDCAASKPRLSRWVEEQIRQHL